MREPLCKSHFPERFQHSTGEKNYKFGGIAVGKRKFDFIHAIFLPDDTAKGQKKSSLAHDISCGKEKEWVSTQLSSCMEAAKGAHFSVTPSRVLNYGLCDWQARRSKESDK